MTSFSNKLASELLILFTIEISIWADRSHPFLAADKDLTDASRDEMIPEE